MTLGNSPGSAGIITIAVACIAVSAIISFVTGSYVHWLPVLIGIAVGLWAVGTMNK